MPYCTAIVKATPGRRILTWGLAEVADRDRAMAKT
jgi:hypothetical protein